MPGYRSDKGLWGRLRYRDSRLSLALYESCKILVVEDEALQALDLDHVLDGLGCKVLGPVDTTAGALALLQQERPNVALLDMMLHDGSGLPVAGKLVEDDVPFSILSGGNHDPLEHPILRGALVLQKPYSRLQLCASIRQLSHTDLTTRLDRAGRLIGETWQRIESQAKIIDRLAIAGHDTGLAKQLLQTYERTMAVLHDQHGRIEKELQRQDGGFAI